MPLTAVAIRNAKPGAKPARLYDSGGPERVAMMQQWADMLEALVRGAKVIPLQRRA